MRKRKHVCPCTRAKTYSHTHTHIYTHRPFIRTGHSHILRVLHGWGVNALATIRSGHNAVHIAARFGRIDILRILHGWGVDAHATTNSGQSAVHLAAEFGQLDALRILHGWGVNLHATTNSGHSAVHIAAQFGKLDVLTELKQMNVCLNIQAKDGTTPLRAAVERNDLVTARHLVLLLGLQVQATDFPAYRIKFRRQLTAWAEEHLARHRVFTFTVLAAIHDDGSHSADGRTNWLVHFAGRRELRINLAEYLGIKVGAEHAALKTAFRVLSKPRWKQLSAASKRLLFLCAASSRCTSHKGAVISVH